MWGLFLGMYLLNVSIARWRIYNCSVKSAIKRKRKLKGKHVHLNEYQKQAATFILPSAETPAYLVPALAEEVGEVAALFAKAVRAEKPLSHESLKKELGDVLWNVANIAQLYGMTLEDVAITNITKLTERRMNNTIVAR
jgi:NTP pyrophosphatase (non-canonical NTP hydrolase)